MATRIRAGLTAAEGRSFGLTLGAAFAVVGGIAMWRGHPTSSTAFVIVSALLLIAAVVAPVQLTPVQRAWMGLAAAMSKVTTPVFMGVVYFAVITPIGWLRRTVGKGRLRSHAASSAWVLRASDARTASSMERQF